MLTFSGKTEILVMKIIPADHQRAGLWVDACVASLRMDRAEAAAMFANLCGFRTWDEVSQVIGTQRPSPYDESLEKEILASRRDNYIRVLVEIFGLNPFHASYLVRNLSPSSQKLPRKISFDSSEMHDPDKDGRIPLIPPGMEDMMEEGMEAFLDMMKESNPEFAKIDTTNFAERMRISKPVNPGLYWDYCANHGWEPIEETYKEEYVFGEPSFSLKSKVGQIPVYANSIVQLPYDEDDEMAIHVREVVLCDAMESDDDPTLILFWGSPITKKVDGLYFTCPGSLYAEGRWHDILLNKLMTSVDLMIDKVVHGIDFNNPDKSFEDKQCQSIKTFLALQVGATDSDELSKFEIVSIGSASGWSTPFIGEKTRG
jgi:hypothetical protein